ncbi:MAG TPA: hypothetical protein VFO55_13280 [Gemmatimonadaceae bacterium]|nr:hypothetical protein [Gemmatimonadaceae bacterium]
MPVDPRETRHAAAAPSATPDLAEKGLVETSPLDPEARRRRRRFVRVVTLLAVLGGVGLSFIPRPMPEQPAVVEVRSGNAVVRTTAGVMSGSHLHGLPFGTATAEMTPTGDLERLSVHPMGIFGNFAVAVALALGLSVLFRRRRRRS